MTTTDASANKPLDIVSVLAEIRAEAKKKEDAADAIDVLIERCNQINQEYNRRARLPIAWTGTMLSIEVRRALRTLGTVYVGYDDNSKYGDVHSDNPKFRIINGYCYNYNRSSMISPLDVVVTRGADVSAYIKDAGLRKAFDEFLAYADSRGEQFRCEDRGHADAVQEPNHKFEPRMMYNTTYEGVRKFDGVAGIRIAPEGFVRTPDDFVYHKGAKIELFDEDDDEVLTEELTDFIVAQLGTELDALLEKREAMSRSNLAFIREVRAKIGDVFGPFMALRAL